MESVSHVGVGVAVARKAPPALRYLNLRNNDGKLVRHVLNASAWKVLISAIILAILPGCVYKDRAGRDLPSPQTLDYDRFRKARKLDACMLCHDKGRGRRLHQPVHVAARPGDEWVECTLTQNPDSRWQARFTHIPDWLHEIYDSPGPAAEKLRQKYKTVGRLGRPSSGRTITLPALICWWAYGKPRDGLDTATHFVCDQPRCLNPRHLGWATNADNSSHAAHHRRTLKRKPRTRVPRRNSPPARRLEYHT